MSDDERSENDKAIIGQIVAGRYEILAHLGSGGMGSVFKARQIAMDRPVALKLLHAHFATNKQAVARFNREMQVTARVEHPNTIRVYDYGQTEDGRLFLAIEFIEGRTLSAALGDGEPMASERIVHIGLQIARALAAAHHDGVVHRDLKPDNVMLADRYEERDFVKVLDFGIARFADDQERTNLTADGAVIGTPVYMSPEQATGSAVDFRSDIYSFGVMLFQMATGRVPFDAPTTISLMTKHVHDEPPRPSDFAPGLVPEAIETLILQMLAKNPAARPPTAVEVARLLEAAVPGASRPRRGALAADTWPGIGLADTGVAPALADTGVAAPVAGSRTATKAVPGDLGIGQAPPPRPRGGSRRGLFAAIALFVLGGGVAAAVVASGVGGASPDVVDARPDAVVRDDADAGTVVAVASAKPGRETVQVTGEAAAEADGAVTGVEAVAGVEADTAGDEGVEAHLGAEEAPDADPGVAQGPEADPGGEEGEEVAAVADEDAANGGEVAVAPERVALDAALAAVGEPAAPEPCRAEDVEVMGAITAALGRLDGGNVGGARDADAEALARLALVGDAARGSAEYWVVTARARLFGGKSAARVLEAGTRAVALCDRWAAAHNAVGSAHLRLDERDMAQASYRRAAELSAGYIAPRFNLGVLALMGGDARAAIDAFTEVIGRAPEYPRVRMLRGQAYLSAGEHERAIADLAAELDRDSAQARVWLLLGQARAAFGEQAAASVAFCKAKELGASEASELCPH